jgi:ABC-type lipoprotein export system ATPase subunit
VTVAHLELIDLAKHFRQGKDVVRAVDGISLKIEPGEFVAVVGRSGSGKTTALDLIGLLLRPTSGAVLIDGGDAGGAKDGRRSEIRSERIGFIFQDYNLLPALSVLENVMLPLRYARSKVKDGKARALDLLGKVGLEDSVYHAVNQLSGGQQQRVAIARALINRPAVVLGDEPTGAVDSQTSVELISLMRRMNREEGVTFVIVTHDLDLAAQTDRVVQLKDGRVVSDAAPAASIAG